MIGARVLVATLALWIVGGSAFEAKQYADRAVSRAVAEATTAKMVAEENLAQAHRFIRACLQGEPAPLGDELLYACKTKRLQLKQHHVREELDLLQSKT